MKLILKIKFEKILFVFLSYNTIRIEPTTIKFKMNRIKKYKIQKLNNKHNYYIHVIR